MSNALQETKLVTTPAHKASNPQMGLIIAFFVVIDVMALLLFIYCAVMHFSTLELQFVVGVDVDAVNQTASRSFMMCTFSGAVTIGLTAFIAWHITNRLNTIQGTLNDIQLSLNAKPE